MTLSCRPEWFHQRSLCSQETNLMTKNLIPYSATPCLWLHSREPHILCSIITNQCEFLDLRFFHQRWKIYIIIFLFLYLYLLKEPLSAGVRYHDNLTVIYSSYSLNYCNIYNDMSSYHYSMANMVDFWGVSIHISPKKRRLDLRHAAVHYRVIWTHILWHSWSIFTDFW